MDCQTVRVCGIVLVMLVTATALVMSVRELAKVLVKVMFTMQ